MFGALRLWRVFALVWFAPVVAAVGYPSGVYESAGGVREPGDNVVARTPRIEGQEGVLVRVAWGLCGDDLQCLADTIALNLDSAFALDLKVALAVGDGDLAPAGVKSRCQLFDFTFRDEPASICVPWDENYLADKVAMLNALAQFNVHPALSHVYFTAACSTNGFEGHCRVNEGEYVAAGYTPERLNSAYTAILQAYLDAFSSTPITFEAHAIFDRIDMWEALWSTGKTSGRVGVAAWWCSERLSQRGHDTVPVWSLVQEIAETTYAVCQTVGNFSSQPYRFSDSQLPIALDYGTESAWSLLDVDNAFTDTLDWVAGIAVHAGQTDLSPAFGAIEVWTEDLENPSFLPRLETYLDSPRLFTDGFEGF